jgi:hypothetical protein
VTSKKPFGILKVLAGGQINLAAEYEELFGGSQFFPWAIEPKNISPDFSATVKQMEDFMFELYLAATVTTTAASATGTVSTVANQLGTSCVSATVGIASVTLKANQEADMKDGHLVFVVASATTVDVYYSSDLEFKRGNDLSFLDDLLLVEAGITVPDSGGTVDIANTGLEITGGSGTVNMANTGDTAECIVFSPHGGLSEILIGASGATFPEHNLVCVAGKRSQGDTFEMEIYRALGSGFPISLTEMTFAIPDLTVKLIYDSAEDGIATIRAKRTA